jgi:hypothetical protein
VPLVGLTARPLWILAGALAAVMPFVHAFAASWPGWQTPLGGDVSLLIGWHYPFEVWIAFVVAGLALARSGLDRTPVLAAALAGGALVSGIAFALDAATGARASGAASGDDDGVRVWTAEPHSSGLLEVWGSGGLAVAIIAACVLLCRGDDGGGIVGRILLPLRAAGSMPLTAYADRGVGDRGRRARRAGRSRRLPRGTALLADDAGDPRGLHTVGPRPRKGAPRARHRGARAGRGPPSLGWCGE